jgi:hypothetical protein
VHVDLFSVVALEVVEPGLLLFHSLGRFPCLLLRLLRALLIV